MESKYVRVLSNRTNKHIRYIQIIIQNMMEHIKQMKSIQKEKGGKAQIQFELTVFTTTVADIFSWKNCKQ